MRVSKQLKLSVLATAMIMAWPATATTFGQATGDTNMSLGQTAQQAAAVTNQTPAQNWAAAPVAPDVQQARQFLLLARQALATGDLAGENGATKQLQAAIATQADFAAAGDSPQIVQSLIDHHNQLSMMYQQEHPSYDAGAAAFLVKQAESLIKYQDFDTAKMLIEQAQLFNVPFTDAATHPDQLLAIIEVAKQGQAATPAVAAAPQMMAQTPVAQAPMSQPPMPQPPVPQPAAQTDIVQTPPAAMPEAPATQVKPAATDYAATMNTPKQEVMKLMSQAQLAMDQERWEQAQALVNAAAAFKLDDSQFTPDEMRPWQMELKIQTALNLQNFNNTAEPANFVVNETAPKVGVVQANYDPSMDQSRNVQVANFTDATEGQESNNPFQARASQPVGTNFNAASAPMPTRGMQLYQSGMEALQGGEPARAKEYFQIAMQYQDELDANTQKSIRGFLDSPAKAAPPVPQASPSDGLNLAQLNEEQMRAFRNLQSEVLSERVAAEKLLEKSPQQALEKMTLLRSRIASSQINPGSRRPLLTIIDRDISEMQVYIEKNLPQIQHKEEQATRKEYVKRNAQRRIDVQQQLQKLVEEYNDLMREERFAEADVIVRQARDLDPNSETVALLEKQHMFRQRDFMNKTVKAEKEAGFWNQLHQSNVASTPHNGPAMQFDPDSDGYRSRTAARRSRMTQNQYASEADRIIWNKLKNVEVEGEYQGTLSEAVDQLSRQAGINIVFDTMALQAEGVPLDTMVNVPIRQPISLQSALTLILGSANLVYAVENEVVKVTSQDAKRTKLVPKTYYIGDLVMPMNNYQSPLSLRSSQAGQNNNGYGGMMNINGTAPLTVAQNQGPMSQIAMAQQLGGNLGAANPFAGFGGPGGYGGGNNGPQTGTPIFQQMGQQSRGGVTQADFDQLINLITGVVDSDSWQSTGTGEGTIQAFPPNLSLIVSQTQEVQDEIQDLLKKLRELNDVQIVIEVRFVSIQDNFFERVGIDFDFAINDNSQVGDPTTDTLPRSTVIGRSPTEGVSNSGAPFIPTANQDIQFTQGSFGITTPNFGGFDLTSAANFGFAILSDIEVYFLIQASKGSTRANIMQAPTVTMFNGQSANVTDGSSRPFVTSVTPVVGDFAVAHAPVITILPDGTSLNVSAVVSSDRRSVRLSLVPFFSQVTEVREFTFSGSQRTERSTNSFLDDLLDLADPTNADAGDDELQTTSEGVTIQLPVIATTSVNTVVSVPDGGTVLLGGVKRMTEERIERGVPFLSSIPYVNRLFKNVGVGRETENLMMMVTPRIIIQDEEEEKQLGSSGVSN